MTSAPTGRRLFAKAIDVVVTWALKSTLTVPFTAWLGSDSMAVQPGSVLIAYVWLMLSDSFKSPGKVAVGLRCIDAGSGRSCSLWQSLLQNLVFVPSCARAVVSAAAGPKDAMHETWAFVTGLLGLVSALVLIAEIRWMSRRADRRRFGDAMGDTRVTQVP